MRKLLLMLLLFSLVLPVFAEEERGLRVDASAGYTGSINSSFISVRPEALYDFGLLALGGGVNTLFGLTYSDIYIAPYAGFELGWFYLNGGAVFELAPPDPDAAPNGYVEADTALSPYFTLGANAAFLPIGPGKLGFDLSLGIIPTGKPGAGSR
jgi:hypothetical protein